MKRLALNILIFLALVMAAQVLLTLDYSLGTPPGKRANGFDRMRAFRARVPSEGGYRPDPVTLQFQSHMKLHPTLGFVFKENLGADEPLEIRWADQESGPMTTDENGFVNSPHAIEARKAGERVRIVGAGSSFLQGAAVKFHDFFWAKGLFYYSVATPRHTFPQFTTAVREYALPLDPDWILYDVNEACFESLRDYQEWSRSGMDWFTYHSGTWSGPPRPRPIPLLHDFPTAERLYLAIRHRVAPSPPLAPLSDEEAAALALDYVVKARDAAQAHGIGFLALVIPSRDFVMYGKSARQGAMESLLRKLAERGVPVLDLRVPFSQEEDPSALYYRVDAHWNDYGIHKAGLAIAAYIKEAGDRRARAMPESQRKREPTLNP